MKFFYRALLGLACCATATTVDAIELTESMRVIVSPDAVTDFGVLGSFTYSQSENTFYTCIFGGEAGLNKITNNGSGWSGGQGTYVWDNENSAYTSTMKRFIQSTDVPGGVTDADNYGYTCPSAILLNPTELTIDLPDWDESGQPISDGNGGYQTRSVTYGPGELAYIMDMARTVESNGVEYPDQTKILYRWDLRSVDDPAVEGRPDYATAQSGMFDDEDTKQNPIVWGSTGVTDWNDMLSTVATEQNLIDAATADGAEYDTHNLGRQFAWSSDGQSIYMVESSKYQGGIYRVDAGTGEMNRIYREDRSNNLNAGSNVGAEPTLINTSVVNYGAVEYYDGGWQVAYPYEGEQIIFDGSEANGNDGGLCFITYNETTEHASPLMSLIDGDDFREWTENPNIGINSITSDDAGNLYFYAYGSYTVNEDTDDEMTIRAGGLYARDTEGRVINLVNRAEQYELNATVDGKRNDGGGMIRLQTYSDEKGLHVLYRGDNKYIGEVDVPTLGDLTGDDLINDADKAFMLTQYRKSCEGDIPSVSEDGQEAFLDYLHADLNGSACSTKNGTGTLDNVAVNFTDVETLAQFIEGGLEEGDLNWDGLLDVNDWKIFYDNLDEDPTLGIWSWFDGDLDLDGDVDADDQELMPEVDFVPGDANGDGVVDGSDVTILANHWQYGINDTTVKAANPFMGDFNGDGVVDGSDVTILANHWQEGITTSAAAVPEPSTLMLLLAGIGALLLRGYVRKR